jgi:hypothetical protein
MNTWLASCQAPSITSRRNEADAGDQFLNHQHGRAISPVFYAPRYRANSAGYDAKSPVNQ